MATGIGADVLVGGIWQGVSDAIEHPWLWATDHDLAWRRIGAGATANSINGVIGGSIGAGVAFLFGVSPAGWAAVGIGVVATVIWDVSPWGQGITTWVFDSSNSNILRSLKPLQLP